MLTLAQDLIEKELVDAVDEIKNVFKIEATINANACPGNIIASQILVTLMSRLGKKLGITIPDNCYIFHDKTAGKQLSIKEAAQKLIKLGKNGN